MCHTPGHTSTVMESHSVGSVWLAGMARIEAPGGAGAKPLGESAFGGLRAAVGISRLGEYWLKHMGQWPRKRP